MIVVAGLILAFVLILIFSNRQTRQCRWRRDSRGDTRELWKYRCMACGAETFTSDGKPPLICMANHP